MMCLRRSPPWLLALVALLIAACGAPADQPTPTMNAIATAAAPTVAASATSMPAATTEPPQSSATPITATEPPQSSATPEAAPAYHNEVLGIQLLDDFGLEIMEDQALNGRDYGFYMSEPTARQDPNAFGLRVAMLLTGPTSVEEAVEILRAGDPSIDVQPVPITVGGEAGVLVEGMPGIVGTSHIYLEAHGLLYEFLFMGGRLSDDARSVLDSVRFVPPTMELDALGLPPLD